MIGEQTSSGVEVTKTPTMLYETTARGMYVCEDDSKKRYIVHVEDGLTRVMGDDGAWGAWNAVNGAGRWAVVRRSMTLAEVVEDGEYEWFVDADFYPKSPIEDGAFPRAVSRSIGVWRVRCLDGGWNLVGLHELLRPSQIRRIEQP